MGHLESKFLGRFDFTWLLKMTISGCQYGKLELFIRISAAIVPPLVFTCFVSIMKFPESAFTLDPSNGHFGVAWNQKEVKDKISFLSVLIFQFLVPVGIIAWCYAKIVRIQVDRNQNPRPEMWRRLYIISPKLENYL